jgi:hypothetical protein
MQDVPEAEYTIAHLPKHVFLVYTPLQAQKLQGLAKVVNGRIEVKPWEPSENPAEEEAASPPTEPSEEATSPEGVANIPDVGSSSPTDTAPDSAGSTSSSGNESKKPD